MLVTNRPSRPVHLVIATLVSLFVVSQAHADVVIGDIAPGNNLFSGYAIGPSGGINNAIAQGFTMTQTVNLSSVDIYLANFQAQAGSNIALSIYSSVSGKPGTDLYDFSTNIVIPTSGTPTLVNLTGSGSFALTAGNSYWLNLYATNPSSNTGTTVIWNGVLSPSFAFTNPVGLYATDLGQVRSIGAGNPPTGAPSTSELRTAFQINGAVAGVPEPGSLTLVILGAGGFAGYRWRRNRAAAN